MADTGEGGACLLYTSSLMDYFLNRNRNHFIDWEQGECYFTEDEFIQFLSFIKSQAETGKTPAVFDRNEIEESLRSKEFLFYRGVLNDIGAFCNYDKMCIRDRS